MASTLLSVLAIASSLSFGVQAEADWSHPSCHATHNWPGWKGIKHAFIFGDSYTTTNFTTWGEQPTLDNPLGNPPYPGWTASNGPNWVDFLTVKYNESKFLTYNLAYGGATIDSELVAPYEPTVLSVAEQIQNEFFPSYTLGQVPWTSGDTLFAVFDGINDVGNSWSRAETGVLNNAIYSVYHGLVDALYYAGARNFLFLNVPPVDRSPLAKANTAAQQATEKADIAAWNAALISLAKALKQDRSDVNIFTVDTNKYFTEVLDNPKSYPATSLYKNTTAYCTAYANGTPTDDYLNATACEIPVNEYFWLNSLHPTYPMHDVLAQQVSLQLEAGPNVC